MLKAVELVMALVLLIFAFFAGVRYSDDVKSSASWMFETEAREVITSPSSNSPNKETIPLSTTNINP